MEEYKDYRWVDGFKEIDIVIDNACAMYNCIKEAINRLNKIPEQGITIHWLGKMLEAIEEKIGPPTCENGHHHKYDPCTAFQCDDCGGPVCQETLVPVQWATGSTGAVCQSCKENYIEIENEVWGGTIHIPRYVEEV